VSLSTSYRVDQLSGVDRLDHEDDMDVAIPSFQQAADSTYEEFYELVLEQLNGLLPQVQRAQESIWIQRIVESAYKELEFTPNGRALTAEEGVALSHAIAARFAQELRPRIEEAARQRREAESAGMSASELTSVPEAPESSPGA
jgi:hypothetical protein